MNTTTLNNRIAKELYTKSGKIAVKYAFFADFLVVGKWHGKSWNGRGNYINLSASEYNAAIEICQKLGIDFELGNDAPRGGKSGDFVALTAKGKRQVAPWVKVEKARRAEVARIEAEKRAAKIAETERKIAEALDAINANRETVAEILGTPDGYLSKRQYGGRIHHLAHRLQMVNCKEFFVAVNLFFNPNYQYNPAYL